MTVITNRLKRISKKGRKLNPIEKGRYAKSATLRYLAAEPIYLIGYVQYKIPMSKNSEAPIKTVDELSLNFYANRYMEEA